VQPPASLKALGDPIYEAFYGLTEQPFAITTDPRFFYLSASHQRAFSELLNGLRRREAVMLVTGETGAGKTTLCRAVIDALGERTFAAMILNPYMTGAEVLRIVLRDFGLVSHEDLRRGTLASADVAQLLDTLEGFLQSLAPIGSHAVIVLDEAQSLPSQTLDQIRLLTGLEHQGHRLVQVVLCGQTGLLTTLKTEALSALNERITRRVEVGPLPPDQVEGYIQHRLAVAGGTNAVSFDAGAARVIADLSHGVPRRINVLCDRALQEGRIEGVSVITTDLVKRAARALAGAHDPMPAAPVAPPIRPPVAPTTPPAAATPVAPATPAAPSAAAAATFPSEQTGRQAAAGAAAKPTEPPVAPVAARTTAALAPAGAAAAPPIERSALTAGAAATRDSSPPMFGHAEEPAPTGRRKALVLAAVGLLVAAAAGYAAYARSIPEPAEVIPARAPATIREVGLPADPMPVPSPEEIATLNELFPPARRAVVQPIGPPPAAPVAAPALPAVEPAVEPTNAPAAPVSAPPPPQGPERVDQVD